MGFIRALGQQALRSNSLRQLTEATSITQRLLDDRPQACQASASGSESIDAQAANFGGAASTAAAVISCAPGPGNSATDVRDSKAVLGGLWRPESIQRGFATAAESRIGTIYIVASQNNTICTLVDGAGNPAGWCSAGTLGFKNSRKSTTYAAQATAEKIAAKSLEKGFLQVRLVMKGLGFGKQSAARALMKSGLKITEIHEQTAIPYNGCRAPKRRRG